MIKQFTDKYLVNSFYNCKNYNQKITLRKGLHLYRSTIYNVDDYKDKKYFYENNIPKPTYDKFGTEKSGVYFAVINPTLSDFMTLEYNKDMFLYTYVLTDNIIVDCGKWKYTNNLENDKTNTNNVLLNHLEINLSVLSLNYDDNRLPTSYEVFITEPDLNKIKYIDKKFITVDDIKKKYKSYCLNKSMEEIINERFNITINFYNKEFINGNNLLYDKYKVINVTIYNIKKDIDNKISYDIVLTLFDETSNETNKYSNNYSVDVKHESFYPQ